MRYRCRLTHKLSYLKSFLDRPKAKTCWPKAYLSFMKHYLNWPKAKIYWPKAYLSFVKI